MSKKIHYAGIACAILFISNTAWAWPYSYYVEYGDHATLPEVVTPTKTVPHRPLVLQQSQATAYSGLNVDLSDNTGGRFWSIPLGLSYGLLPRLEVGMEMLWLLAFPKGTSGTTFDISHLVANARFHGRFLIIKNHLAAEVGIQVPTTFNANFGVELLVPARYTLSRIDIFGQARFLYNGSGTKDTARFNAFLAGFSVTAIFDIAKGIFASFDTGYSWTNLQAVTHNLPVGIGAGYKLSNDMFLRLAFVFSNLTYKDPTAGNFEPLAQRTIQFSVVQPFDLKLTRPEQEAQPEPGLPPEYLEQKAKETDAQLDSQASKKAADSSEAQDEQGGSDQPKSEPDSPSTPESDAVAPADDSEMSKETAPSTQAAPKGEKEPTAHQLPPAEAAHEKK